MGAAGAPGTNEILKRTDTRAAADDSAAARRDLRRSAGYGRLAPVSQTEIFLAIVGLIAVEIYHLKWIWWEHWMCRSCGTQNKNCSCGPPPKWFKYL